ncbi:DUF2637 domain-containing protein [Nonomuraea sp. NN258]|uniref:DUF2637 domain-containing protein n=1 Tax=Nonomuraea antri TaxID=2730852 RepID=UPI0015687317|nr:DUF2637 domain-containing protein [Nonomuraea antri]NRQ30662.1 DUF2637 domain-containing protein [Nonomuraea antri]
MSQYPSTPTIGAEANPADEVQPKRVRRFFANPFRHRRSHAVPAAARPVETGAGRLGDRVILGFAVAVLLAVAAAAAYVSYHHFYGLAIALGERHDMAILYPAMSDGVIVMASLVMVYCSRRTIRVPVLAWVALALGGAVTLAANVAHGWSGGLGSRLVSALAPLAFAGAYELLMWIVRNTRRPAAEPPAEEVEEHVCQPIETVVEVERVVPMLAADRYEAARLAYLDSLGEGKQRLGRRPLMNRWGLEQREAEEIIAEADREQAQAAAVKEPETPGAEAAVPSLTGVEPTGTSEAEAA